MPQTTSNRLSLVAILVAIITAVVGWGFALRDDPQLTDSIAKLEIQNAQQLEEINSLKALLDNQKQATIIGYHRNLLELVDRIDRIADMKDDTSRLRRFERFQLLVAPQKEMPHEPTRLMLASLDTTILNLKEEIAQKQAAKEADDAAEAARLRRAAEAEAARRKADEDRKMRQIIEEANRQLQSEKVCQNANCSSFIIR